MLLGSLILTACSQGEAKTEAANGPKRREPTRVRTAPVEQREMVRTLTTTTAIESEHEVKIYPRTSGVVTEIKAEEGDRVTTGTVLAVLDRRQTKSMIEDARMAVREAEDNVHKVDMLKTEAESRIVSSQIKFDQTARDYERNVKAANLISAQALDNLKTVRDTAQNDLDNIKLIAARADIESKAVRTTLEKTKLALEREQLDDSYMEITAAFDGVIATRTVKVGDAVGPGVSVFVLTDVRNLRAIFHRPQRELPLFLTANKLREDGGGASGSALEIRALPEALPGVVFKAELMLVSPSIDPQSGSFRVTVRMGEPIEGPKDSRLLPGMLVRLEIVTERHPDALAVPKRALRREGEQNLVFVFDAGKAKRVEVIEGFSDDAAVEVRPVTPGAIAAGMRVIVVGNRELEDGAEISEEAVPEPADASKSSAQPETQKG